MGLSKTILSTMLLISVSPSMAHEYWIEAGDYSPEVGDTVALTTRVGQSFAGDEVLNIESFYSDYSVASSAGRAPVSGSLATDPPAYIEIPDSDTYIVGQRTLSSQLEMSPDKFITYLKKQGMDYAIPMVDTAKSATDPITEAYSRCVKAIIQSNETNSASQLSSPFGYTLEIIPLSNPVETHAGDNFKIQLLYQGQALHNAQLTALNKTFPEQALITHTDEQGEADITLPYPGIWMLNSVHIIPATNTDWESFWANLTFEISL